MEVLHQESRWEEAPIRERMWTSFTEATDLSADHPGGAADHRVKAVIDGEVIGGGTSHCQIAKLPSCQPLSVVNFAEPARLALAVGPAFSWQFGDLAVGNGSVQPSAIIVASSSGSWFRGTADGLLDFVQHRVDPVRLLLAEQRLQALDAEHVA